MHLFLKAQFLVSCPRCGKETKPHTVCFNCGYYKGEQVIDVMAKLTKKEKKQKQKEISAHGEEDQKPVTMEGLSKK